MPPASVSASTCKMLGQMLKSWNFCLPLLFLLKLNFAYHTNNTPYMYNKSLRQACIRWLWHLCLKRLSIRHSSQMLTSLSGLDIKNLKEWLMTFIHYRIECPQSTMTFPHLLCIFLCPDRMIGAYCFCPVCLSVCLLLVSLSTLTFAIIF